MKDIRSESKLIIDLFLGILLLPFTFIQVIFGKKKFSDMFEPLRQIWEFLLEAKFTLAMIAANLIAFASELFMDEEQLNSLLLYPQNILDVSKYYTFITSGFLHADLVHLSMNMLAILIFGRIVEKKLGAIKSAIVYFLAMIISAVFSCLIHLFILSDNTPGLGASGALMGLVSTAILLEPFYITYLLIVPMPVMVVGWITIYADIFGILNPAQDGIGHFAHLGGFLSIAVIMYLLGDNRARLKSGLLVNLLSLAVISVIYIALLKFNVI